MVQGELTPLVPLRVTSATAVLDDHSVVRLDDGDTDPDPGVGAALAMVALTLLRRVSASPAGAGPVTVLVDGFLHHDQHNAELFLALGGWIDEQRLLTTAVAQSVALRSGISTTPETHAAATPAASPAGLRILAETLLTGHVPQHLIHGACHDPGLVSHLARRARNSAWSLPAELSVPTTPAPYHALVTTRLNQLAPHTRLLTQALAVHGAEVLLAQLARLLGAGQPVADILAPAVDARLVRWASGGLGASLAQETIRAAVLESMNVAVRNRLRRWAANCTTGTTSLLHRAAATDRPDPATAHALDAAAQDSLQAGQEARAAQLVRLAAQLSPAGSDHDRRLVTSVEIGLRAVPSPEPHVMRGALNEVGGARVGLLHARLAYGEGRLEASRDHLVRVLAELEADPDDQHHTLAACAAWMVETAWALQDQDALGRAVDAIEHCHEPSHRCQDTAALARALRSVAAHGVRAGLDTLSFLPADPTQVSPRLAACLQIRGWLQLENCQPDAAETDTLSALRLSTQAGAQTFAPEAAVAVLAQAHSMRGAWDDAEACARLAVELASPRWRELCRSTHRLVLSARGLPASPWPGTQPHNSISSCPLTRATTAHATVIRALEHTTDVGPEPDALRAAEESALSCRMPWRLFEHIRAHCHAGSVTQARRLLPGLAPFMNEAPTAWTYLLGQWAHALVASADRQHEDAARYFGRAEAAASQSARSRAWHRALLGLDHARFLASAGRWSKAVTLLRNAQGAFERLDAGPLAEACGRELVRARFSCALGDEALPLENHLTRREVEVASLAARGMTNKEIGQTLFLSPRGVRYHLGNIYSKLGVPNRYELRTTWALVMEGQN
ncbi:helix-turn-helix transcriptional regulator [Streptomyces luteogriseus]|uniref:helix-turn-helix transcriptional regulator n=1 Tax=Streptomyces luteogriseus TaxID=68233 RepID=UPI002E315577|nr:LuxR C-terminal-related transcriptional regulator [Streptomyces luteogriseus]WTJ25618.1 LuxR C-terminal-related transcriptional regulator [Streptomyces luteogriseus]